MIIRSKPATFTRTFMSELRPEDFWLVSERDDLFQWMADQVIDLYGENAPSPAAYEFVEALALLKERRDEYDVDRYQ